MKKYIFIISILSAAFIFGQKTVEYDNIPPGKNTYEHYITKAGDTITIGEKITIGIASGEKGFRYITQLGQQAAHFLSDKKVEISKIKTYKSKRFSNRAYLQFKGYGAPVDIDYELALKSGEVEPIDQLK